MRRPGGWSATAFGTGLVVVAAVAFVPTMVDALGYSPEVTNVLTYLVALTIGLILGWITVILLVFHWARVVWTRTAVQLAAEAHRRQEAAQRENKNLLDGLEPPTES